MRVERLFFTLSPLIAAALACVAPSPEAPAGRPGPASPISHDLLDAVLGRHVRDGLVDYAALKNDPDFDAYIRLLASTEPASLPSREDRLAFWINAYNALVIGGVLDHYPIRSVSDVGLLGKWSFFKGLEFNVGGKTYTLDRIEHGIIRPEFQEPRAHFGLVCASGGCPRLSSRAFHPETLEAELEEATRRFINDPRKVRLDREKGILYLSRIFSWYEEDFVKGAGSVLKFVDAYLEGRLPEGVHVQYFEYSWALNDLNNPPDGS